MTAPAPQSAENPTVEAESTAARIKVLVTVVEGADLAAALAVLGRQVYSPTPEVVIVGALPDGFELPDGVTNVASLDAAITGTTEDHDYLWILHSDCRPRPDALASLVLEVERNESSLGGSKLLVAGSRDVLEEVGSATDVFGEPYSGLEEGEIDLQQYDVVREVAFVRSASMLVRRDLAQGLGGLDDLLPPVAAGLDFSQRTRLAGGRVISVPSSEVYHQGRCNERLGGWREQAGRMRAMFIAYGPLTLLWVVPLDFAVSVVDSVSNLLLLRWRPLARHGMSWLWNIARLPSTFGRRRRFKKVRVAGDEELFRFQARGSVRLREIGSELSSRLLSIFDEDQTLSKRGRAVMSSPGVWGAVLACLVALVAARSFIFSGVPNTGFSFPFEPASVQFDRWFAGWNDAGLGSSSPVHSSTLITAVVAALGFGSIGAARTLFTLSLAIIGIAGMGRLGGRLGLRGPGRYLAGIVLLSGPGTAVLVGAGSWLALAAAAFLPWVVRAVLVRRRVEGVFPFSEVGWTLIFAFVLAAISPLLVLVPFVFALITPAPNLWTRRTLMGLVALGALLVAVPFLVGDPGWVFDSGRRLFVGPRQIWPVLIGVAALPLVFLPKPWSRVGTVGAVTALSAFVVLLTGVGGPGLEEALLVVTSFGAALIVSAGLDRFSIDPMRIVAIAAASVVLAVSFGTFANGHYGLPSEDLNQRLGFASALAREGGPGRILFASTVRSDVPGEARPGPGFWYRLVDGAGTTQDEVWLSRPRPGDEELGLALEQISSGDELRPGELLAPFAVDWIVLDGPEFRLDDVLLAQLDLVPTPLDPETRVFSNSSRAPLAVGGDAVWERDGAGFAGNRVGAVVRLAVNHSSHWSPTPTVDGWAVGVDGQAGRAVYRGPFRVLSVTILGALVGIAALGSIVYGRVRR